MSGKNAEPDTNHNQIKTTARKFVLKHVFKNVSKLGTNKQYWSDIEGHFRVPWSIIIKHNKDDLAVFLHCDRSENKKEWSIDTEFEIHVFHPSGNTAHKVSNMSYCFSKSIGYGQDKLMTWERMEKEFLLNDELVVEIRVKITEMIGTKSGTLKMSGKSAEPDTNNSQIETITRKFVLKHVFKNMSKMKDMKNCKGPTEFHFRVPW
ncbi:hypothetical protein CAEBREN_20661 [Caenorhabditis brenneri]|uniref:MATH domain-containing protein n=1 Tax=Caenorhabditis brenneri TaxID=135651 RepID=G0MV35_CAEBE|nr:hypothetical protein CAEBREN_20661 [Caenorhabditis brenneri]